MAGLIGKLVDDVVVNRQELDGLMAGLVASDQTAGGGKDPAHRVDSPARR